MPTAAATSPPGSEENPFLHTWSLGVEEQLCIFLPIAMTLIFVSLAKRPGIATRRIQAVLGTVAVLSLLISVALVDFDLTIDPGINALTFDSAKLGFYLSLGRFWELLAGVLLPSSAFITRDVRPDLRLCAGVLGVAILVCVGVPLALAAVVYVGAQQRWGLDEPTGWNDIPIARDAGCHVNDVAADFEFDVEDCIFPAPSGGAGTIVVVGDSHASSISSAVIAAGHERDYDVAGWSGSGCPFIFGADPDLQLDDCLRWVNAARDVIDGLQPDVVAIANRATIYNHPTGGEPENHSHRLTDTNGRATANRQEALDLWSSSTEQTIAELESAGSSVIVFGTVPEFWPDFVDEYSLARSYLKSDTSRAELEERQAEVDAAMVSAVPDTAAFIDPTDTICPSFPCHPCDDEDWRYYDPDQLNEPGSRLLAEQVEAALADLLS